MTKPHDICLVIGQSNVFDSALYSKNKEQSINQYQEEIKMINITTEKYEKFIDKYT